MKKRLLNLKIESDRILNMGICTIKLSTGEEIVTDCFFVDEEKYSGRLFCRIPLRINERYSNSGELEKIFLIPFTNQEANFNPEDNITIHNQHIISFGKAHRAAAEQWKNNLKIIEENNLKSDVFVSSKQLNEDELNNAS